jgi:predicted dinucleotide-binding enzyme
MNANNAMQRNRRRLVRDAGHEPVTVGELAPARDFDYGTPVFGRPMTAAELRKALGLKP